MNANALRKLEELLIQEEIDDGKIDRILAGMTEEDVAEGIDDDKIDPTEEVVPSPAVYGGASYFSHAFVVEGKIGSGGFAFVYSCRHMFDGLRYAVKKVPITQETSQCSLGEAKKMAMLTHEFIVRYYQAWIEDEFHVSLTSSSSGSSDGPETHSATQSLYIAMELCPRYFRQMLQGLVYIHGEGIVHGDLSPRNIFIDAEDNIKIGDFGLATLMGEMHEILTPDDIKVNLYRCPETEQFPIVLTDKADIFSLGLILYEMIHPIDTMMEKLSTFSKIREGIFDWGEADQRFMRYVPKLFARDPHARSSADDLLTFLDEGN